MTAGILVGFWYWAQSGGAPPLSTRLSQFLSSKKASQTFRLAKLAARILLTIHSMTMTPHPRLPYQIRIFLYNSLGFAFSPALGGGAFDSTTCKRVAPGAHTGRAAFFPAEQNAVGRGVPGDPQGGIQEDRSTGELPPSFSTPCSTFVFLLLEFHPVHLSSPLKFSTELCTNFQRGAACADEQPVFPQTNPHMRCHTVQR